MTDLCDIFKLEANGQARWLEAAPNFDSAKARIQALGKESPGNYLIYTENIDKKLVFRVGAEDGEPVEVRASLPGDSRDLEEQLLDNFIELARGDFGTLQLFDCESRSLKMVVQRGFSKRFQDCFGTIRADDACACGTVLKGRKRVIVGDIYREPIFSKQSILDALTAENVRAVQSLPMVTSGFEFVGVLSAYYRTAGIPSERQSAISDRFLTDAADLIEKRLRGRTEY
jgi:GAF domain-containing protein